MNANRPSPTARLAILATACALAALTSAQAGDAPAGRPAVAVRYDDLNLATDAGARMLYTRLRHAAARVCPGVHDRDMGRASRARACRDSAVAAAVARVASPPLAALHARGGARS